MAARVSTKERRAQREFEYLLHDPSRMPYFLDFLMDLGGHNILMFWLEAEQFAEFTGDARECLGRARGLVERYIGLSSPDDDDDDDDDDADADYDYVGGSAKPDQAMKLRTTLALSRAVKERLRRAVSTVPPKGGVGAWGSAGFTTEEDNSSCEDYPDPDAGGSTGSLYDERVGSDGGEDEEANAVCGARWGRYGDQAPRRNPHRSRASSSRRGGGGDSGKESPGVALARSEATARLLCASADLFCEAQAQAAAQLYRDWYSRFVGSAANRRLGDFLFAQAAKTVDFKDPTAVEALLDAPHLGRAPRRIIERYLDGTRQRLGLRLRDLMCDPSGDEAGIAAAAAASGGGAVGAAGPKRGKHYFHLREVLAKARQAIKPRAFVAPAAPAAVAAPAVPALPRGGVGWVTPPPAPPDPPQGGTPATSSGCGAVGGGATDQLESSDWSLVEVILTLERVHEACGAGLASLDFAAGIERVSDAQTALAFRSVREDTEAFLVTQQQQQQQQLQQQHVAHQMSEQHKRRNSTSRPPAMSLHRKSSVSALQGMASSDLTRSPLMGVGGGGVCVGGGEGVDACGARGLSRPGSSNSLRPSAGSLRYRGSARFGGDGGGAGSGGQSKALAQTKPFHPASVMAATR